MDDGFDRDEQGRFKTSSLVKTATTEDEAGDVICRLWIAYDPSEVATGGIPVQLHISRDLAAELGRDLVALTVEPEPEPEDEESD